MNRPIEGTVLNQNKKIQFWGCQEDDEDSSCNGEPRDFPALTTPSLVSEEQPFLFVTYKSHTATHPVSSTAFVVFEYTARILISFTRTLLTVIHVELQSW